MAHTDLRERGVPPRFLQSQNLDQQQLKLLQHHQQQQGDSDLDQPQQHRQSFRQHMLAGSIAGVAEHTAMFPIDTLKTRVQMLTTTLSSSSAGASSSPAMLLSLIRHQGPLGLYRGVGAMIMGAGPSHAVYFAVYEECKRRLEDLTPSTRFHPIAHMFAGACATVASDGVSTPMDVVKQRLQVVNSPYSGVGDCVRRVLREEGFRAFYASYRTTIVMNIPFTGVHFAAYEAAKKALGNLSYHGGGSEDHLITHLVAGGSAGALASAVTTPLDVIKTRLQCQGMCGAERFDTGTSVREVARRIVSQEGFRAMFRGIMPRVLFHTPAAAISWSTYEAGKAFLQRWNQHY